MNIPVRNTNSLEKEFQEDYLGMFQSIDLEVQEMFINNKIKSLIGAVLTRGKYILWPEVAKLKGRLSFSLVVNLVYLSQLKQAHCKLRKCLL